LGVGRASKRSEVLTVHTTEAFDALVSDLHLPPEQDGFIVLGATRHSHPKAWTVIVTDSPAADETAPRFSRKPVKEL
jgi:DNA-binding NtrC family response regulator